MRSLLDQVANLTDWHLKGILHLRKIDIWKSNIPCKTIDSINLQSTKSVTDLRYIFCQSYYIISTAATALVQSETISFDQNAFSVINDLKKKQKCSDIGSIYKEIIKTTDFQDTTTDDL